MVITGLTRNQLAGNRTRVRIPSSPPKETAAFGRLFLLAETNRIRKDGLPEGQVTKCPVDTWLVRGRIHRLMNVPGTGVGISLSFVAEIHRRKN